MHRIIISIFLFLVILCSCSDKSEQAADLINKADALLSEKEFKEPQKAIEYLTKAIELQPDNDYTYNMRGSIYMTTGKNQLAYDDFNKAIQLNSKMPIIIITVESFVKKPAIIKRPSKILTRPYSLIQMPRNFITTGDQRT